MNYNSAAESDRFNWKVKLQPGFKSTLERVNFAHSSALQLQRRTGAGRFVWSSAVEDYFAFAGNLLKVCPQFCRTQYLGAYNLLACSLDLCRTA